MFNMSTEPYGLYVAVHSLGAVQIASVGASPSQAAARANDVEQCQCGPGYSGLSCEVRFVLSFVIASFGYN